MRDCSIRKSAPLRCLALLLATFSLASVAHAQNPAPLNPDQQTQPSPQQNPDAQVVTTPAGPPPTPAQLHEQAWTMLTSAVTDSKHPDLRVQALAALGLLGDNPRSLALIADAMSDKDIDVRSASAVAAGQTKSPSVTTSLRRMLDDKEPPVAFAAALTLWKMNDQSGEDIIMAVADGERTAASGALNSATHTVSRDLRHPGTLARFGAMQGAGMLLGPFGMGISAFEYLHKNGGDVARVSAIEALARSRTTPVRLELLAALQDKDPGVRASAAKALSTYRDPDIAAAIAHVFDDSKPPVRLTAAASYILASQPPPPPPLVKPDQPCLTPEPKHKPTHRKVTPAPRKNPA